MKIKLIVVITFILGFGAFNNTEAQITQEGKIGYVNPQLILANMPEMKAVQQRLQNLALKKQQELSTLEQAFQADVTVYQQKVGVISAEAQKAEEERLSKLQNELMVAKQTAESELEQKRQEFVGPLFEDIRNAINTVANRMKLTYVLNNTTSTGDQIILYVSESYGEKYNLTEAVMEELGMF